MRLPTGPRATAAKLGGFVALMLCLSFAAVPFYSWFCQTTGYAGTTMTGTGADEILDQTISIRFDASLDAGMPWQVRPLQRQMQVRIGETGLAFYEAYNPTDKVLAGQASYNVAPDAAGGFFTKIDCFCFTLQVLQPGERVQMPLTFYVDPAIVADEAGKHVKHITLSYTFHLTDLPDQQASLAPAPASPVN